MQANNNVSITGNLVRNPETVKSTNGQPFLRFKLAVSRFHDGKEYTDFISFIAWGKMADNISKNTKKGDQLITGGRLSVQEWKDPEGNFCNRTEVVVSGFQFGRKAKANQ